MSDHTTPEEPSFEMPAFDERAMRRAARRALRRTAFRVVIMLLAAVFVLRWTSYAWDARSSSRFKLVMGHAFEVANPGYRIGLHSGSDARFDFSADLIGSAQAWEPQGISSVDATFIIRRDLRGRISRMTNLPETPLSEVFCCDRRDLKQTGGVSLIGDLPRASVLSAAVELKQPMDEATFTAFRRRLSVCAPSRNDPLAPDDHFEVEARFEMEEENTCGVQTERTAQLVSMLVSPTSHYRAFVERLPSGPGRLSWPWPTLEQFNAWARVLRDSDGPNLKQLSLPRVAEIKKRAADGKIYGFVATRLRPERLRALLEEPLIGEIYVAEVGLDLL